MLIISIFGRENEIEIENTPFHSDLVMTSLLAACIISGIILSRYVNIFKVIIYPIIGIIVILFALNIFNTIYYVI